MEDLRLVRIMEQIQKDFVGQVMILKVLRNYESMLTYEGSLQEAFYKNRWGDRLTDVGPVDDFEGTITLRFEGLEVCMRAHELTMSEAIGEDDIQAKTDAYVLSLPRDVSQIWLKPKTPWYLKS